MVNCRIKPKKHLRVTIKSLADTCAESAFISSSDELSGLLYTNKVQAINNTLYYFFINKQDITNKQPANFPDRSPCLKSVINLPFNALKIRQQ